MHPRSKSRTGRALWPMAAVGVCILAGVLLAKLHAGPAPGEARAGAFQEAVKSGAAGSAPWPATPQALIAEFWKAASARDYKRLTILCPGSAEADYKPYDYCRPSAQCSVGEPVKGADGVDIYPTVLDFTGVPKKTINMAVQKLPDGRFAIEGRQTIWW